MENLKSLLAALFQTLGNKVTSFQETPDDTHYPSEKLVKDSLDAKLASASKASSAEINTGTEDNKYVTPDALAGSDYEKNPMTTAGDIIYGGTSGAPTRLAKGTAGQVLTMNTGATAPEWADASGGGSDDQLLTAVVTVSSADLKALNTSPKTLLSAPGTNKIIILEGVVVYSTGGSISYTGGSAATIYYDDETTAAIPSDIPGSYLAANASTTKIVHVPGTYNSMGRDGMQNRGIVLKTTSDFADGDGTSKLYIKYRICSA